MSSNDFLRNDSSKTTTARETGTSNTVYGLYNSIASNDSDVSALGMPLTRIPSGSNMEANQVPSGSIASSVNEMDAGIPTSHVPPSTSNEGLMDTSLRSSYLHTKKVLQLAHRAEKFRKAKSLDSVVFRALLHQNISNRRISQNDVDGQDPASLKNFNINEDEIGTSRRTFVALARIASNGEMPVDVEGRDSQYGAIESSPEKLKSIFTNDKDALKMYLDENSVHHDDGDDDEVPTTLAEALTVIVFGKGIVSLCLLAMPLALIAVYWNWSATYIFWLNFVSLIPLAAILGDFTEEVALHTNETIGGLINASFGNAVEVIVAIQALLANEIRVVQASMLGSIFSNLLLVLGCCFFFGGLFHKEQTFNVTAATANMALLALSSLALVLPTPFAEYYDLHAGHVLEISRIVAVFMIFMYIQLLVFQLKTHTYLFDGAGGGDDDDAEMAVMSFTMACLGLLIVTCLVALFSEYLVGSIEGFTQASGVSRTFVGIIILPIVGNAVEHITAVTVSIKDKMDLAMGIAVGSCTQISLFVAPLSVLIGWLLGKEMTLNFPKFEIALYVLSVFTVSIVCSNPVCNWLEGSLLITTYALIAVGFWFEDVKPLQP